MIIDFHNLQTIVFGHNFYHSHIDICIFPVCSVAIIIYEEICCVSILFAFLCVLHKAIQKVLFVKVTLNTI